MSIDSTPTGTAGTEAGEHFRFDVHLHDRASEFGRLRADNRVRIGIPVIAVTDESWSASAAGEHSYLDDNGWEDPGQETWRRAAREGLGALPLAARAYVEFVQEELDVPINFVGVGPGRMETLDLRER